MHSSVARSRVTKKAQTQKKHTSQKRKFSTKHQTNAPQKQSKRGIHDRILYKPYESLIISPKEAAKKFLLPQKQGDIITPLYDRPLNLGTSGFTSVGYPKSVPLGVVEAAEELGLTHEHIKYNMFIGASTGPELDDNFAKHGFINKRFPYQLGKQIQGGINQGKIDFADQHLSSFGDRLILGTYSKDVLRGTDDQIDVAVIEATQITEDGAIVPGASVGISPELAFTANKIIIELNTALPVCRGLHDILPYQRPGARDPLLIKSAKDRVGEEFIRVDPKKVVAIVPSNLPDNTSDVPPADDTSGQIAAHIVDFFNHEVKWGRMPSSLFHLQSGIGTIANKVIGGVQDGNFEHVNVWTEVLQDTFLDFFDSGKLDFATSTSIKLSPGGFKRFYDNFDFYKEKIILRNQSISNAPEVISRIGVVAMNTPVEIDIYGHANSTHVGSRVISGLGGSNDFLRHGIYSIMHTPSTRPSKTDPNGISCVVPMVSHCDSTEHDTGIFVTEQGLADMRGLTPVQRAHEVIDKCAHPIYKDQLKDYLNHAITWNLNKGTAHEPHLLDKVFNMHVSLNETGSMRLGDKHKW